MSKLMYYDRFELCVMCRSQHIGIVYTTTAIRVSISQNDDVFVRNARQEVVQVTLMEGRKVAVRIER